MTILSSSRPLTAASSSAPNWRLGGSFVSQRFTIAAHQKQIGNDGTFDAEGEIARIAKQRHFEEMKSLYIRNPILPMREALRVPQFPEKPATQSRQRR